MDFINGQRRAQFADIPYGRSTVGKAGCEAIACYNAMMLLGRPMPFGDVKAFFERLFRRGMGWGFGGILGASPIEIRLFLKKQGIRYIRIRCVRSFNKKTAGGQLPSGVFIVSYWNKPLLRYGFHTVAIDCSSDLMYVFNRRNYSAETEPIGDISELMEGNWRFISGFYIPYGQGL